MAASKKKRVAKAARSSFRKTKAKPSKTAKKPPAKKPPAKKPTAKKPSKATKPTTKPAAKPADTREPVGARVTLGEITTPSGTLAIFDVGLIGYLPREALEPAIVKATVPTDRPLPVVGTLVGKGRFADCWDHVAIILGDGDVHGSKKLGEAGVDFARLICMDHGALDHWQHEDSLDGKADFVFWGRDEGLLARVMGAPRIKDGYGWSGLSLADAEAKADTAARKKAENRWALATDYRPHSHHYYALAAARANPHGAGLLQLAGTWLLLMFTSWGDGVFPIYLDVDDHNRPVQVRIQLATEASNTAMRAVNR
jgi:hypothetical protein